MESKYRTIVGIRAKIDPYLSKECPIQVYIKYMEQTVEAVNEFQNLISIGKYLDKNEFNYKVKTRISLLINIVRAQKICLIYH